MRGRQIWASKSVALLDPKLDLDQKYGILEINLSLFSGISKTQEAKVAEWHYLSQQRKTKEPNLTSLELMRFGAITTSNHAENLPVTRDFFATRIQNLAGFSSAQTEKTLTLFEKHFGHDYAIEILPEVKTEWEEVHCALSQELWSRKPNVLEMNIYDFGRIHRHVFPQQRNFMRTTPTYIGQGTLPFADVHTPSERLGSYFRFKKQLKNTLNQASYPHENNFSLNQLVTYTEMMARLHLAMIYRHFWVELNGRITRAVMSLLNSQFNFLPVILNMDTRWVDQYKKANLSRFINGRKEKWSYDCDDYAYVIGPTVDWFLEQQIKAEQFYAELEALR